MMMDEREDGELSGPEDAAVSANHTSAAASTGICGAVFAAYRSAGPTRGASAAVASSDEDQSSGGDSDDDNCHLKAPTKRRKTKLLPQGAEENRPAFSPEQQQLLLQSQLLQQKSAQQPTQTESGGTAINKKKKNNIWANVIGEQSLTQDIGSVGLKKLEGDRNVENYDFRAAQEAIRNEETERLDEELEEGEMEEEEEGEMKDEEEQDEEEEEEEEAEIKDEEKETRESIDKRLSRKRSISHRTYRPPPVPRPCGEPGDTITLPPLQTSGDWTDEQLATNIAQALQEDKPQIIARVVEVLGQGIAIKLYDDTREIEQKGGMKILNGDRRRTSGGVYLQLLKAEGPSKEDMALIFLPDEAQIQWRRRRRAVRRRRNKQEAGHGGNETSDFASRVSDRPSPPLAAPEDSSDGLAGSKCPGTTPVNSPAHSPGPTPSSTPIVTPHTSDGEDDSTGNYGFMKQQQQQQLCGASSEPHKEAALADAPQDQMDVA